MSRVYVYKDKWLHMLNLFKPLPFLNLHSNVKMAELLSIFGTWNKRSIEVSFTREEVLDILNMLVGGIGSTDRIA